ncbi:MAG: choice-of-anchor B family protein [Chitinophagales bacterium]
MELRSVQLFNSTLSDVWGYASNGREYALVGLNNAFAIVDVTDPEQPDPLFSVPGYSSDWRDIHTWNDHAYVTNEKDGGLLIVDMSNLPDSISATSWTADTLLKSAHNIWIDENGYAYIFGFNSLNEQIPYNNRGVIIADLNNDPKNPDLINIYSENYVHDGYVRGDTMWLGEISAGFFSVVDVSDKNNLQVLASAETPGRFTHNVWLSDDGKTLFTTDEIEGGYFGAYDVSDLNNITELTRYREAVGTGLIPHNTHALGNYLWNSYYTYGVNLVDATRPDNLVETGRYDTSPFPSRGTYDGCWGTYPYLPSGNILASDIQEGLFVFTPTYTRACYLEGTITDSFSGTFLNGVNVELISTGAETKSDILGEYKTGIAESGMYDVRVHFQGCFSKIITDVQLSNGQVTVLDIEFECIVANTDEINEPATLELKAQPSAFNNQTELHFKGLKRESGQLQIFDLAGRVLKSLDLNTESGQVIIGENWAPGFYLAVLLSDNEKIIQKIQKL